MATFTFTLIPTPADATVVLTSDGYIQSGNSITVEEGTNVDWSVSKPNYQTQTGNVIVTETSELDVTLVLNRFTITINPNPADAFVLLTSSDGSTQIGNSIKVNSGSIVSYSVSKTEYITKTGDITVISDDSVSIELDRVSYLFTIQPTPIDATVILTAPGYTQSGNSISVPKNTSVFWEVLREGYQSQSDNTIITETTNLPVTLNINSYTLTIDPNPSEAVVTLTASGYTQSGNSITVPYHTNVSYSVSYVGYDTKSSTYLVTANETIPVDLTIQNFTLTIEPNPTLGSAVVLIADGYTQFGNSISVPMGTSVSWSVTNTNYYPQSGEILITGDLIRQIVLTPREYVITIAPNPVDSVVILTSSGYSQTGNSITVPFGRNVSWEVRRTGYATQTGNITATGNQTLAITLLNTDIWFEIVPTPSTATVILTAPGYTQIDNYIQVAIGTNVEWSVILEGYDTQTGTTTVTENTFLPITLTPQTFLITVNPIPSDSTVVLTADGYTQSGNSISVPYGTVVRYDVSKENYLTKSGSLVCIGDRVIDVTLTSAPILFEINTTPTGAEITLTAEGYTQSTLNSIYVSVGTIVYYRVFLDTYTPVEGSQLVNDDITLDIDLIKANYKLRSGAVGLVGIENLGGQLATDENLLTTDKTIVGAINELYQQLNP